MPQGTHDRFLLHRTQQRVRQYRQRLRAAAVVSSLILVRYCPCLCGCWTSEKEKTQQVSVVAVADDVVQYGASGTAILFHVRTLRLVRGATTFTRSGRRCRCGGGSRQSCRIQE